MKKRFKKVKKNVSETIAAHAMLNNIFIVFAIVSLVIVLVEPTFKLYGLCFALLMLVINFVRNFIVVKVHDRKLDKIKKCNE